MRKIICLLSILLILISFGCNKSPSSVPTTKIVPGQVYKGSDLNEFMFTNGFGSGFIADSQYCIPDKSWLDFDFGRILLKDYMDNNFIYIPDKFDCDKFADESLSVMRKLHTRNGQAKGAIAFGVYWFREFNGKNHAVNFAFVTDQGSLKIEFYEPQTFSMIPPTDQLHDSIFWKL